MMLCLFAGQDAPKPADAGNIQQENQQAETKYNIDSFSEFPPEIDGCACYYSLNEKGFRSGRYIYADDYIGKTAFIKVDGKFQKLSVSEFKHEHLRHRKTMSNDLYDVTVDVEKIGQLEETFQQKGEMTLQSKKGQKQQIQILGECGC